MQENINRFKIISSGNKLLGLLGYTEKPWETNILGYKVAAITHLLSVQKDYKANLQIFNELLNFFCNWFINEKITLASCRISLDDISAIHSLLKADFYLVGVYNTFYHDLKHISDKKRMVAVCLKNQMKGVCQIAEKSFLYDRFHSDPFIDKKAADMTRKIWIKNLFNEKAKEVLITEANGNITGFLGYSFKNIASSRCGILELIAVDPSCERAGFGKSLLLEFLIKCKDKGCVGAYVGTQANNLPSINLYEKSEFRLIKSELTLHKFKKA